MKFDSSLPFLLYTTPRSGGTAVYQTLEATFKDLFQKEGLGEFFCLQYVWRDSDVGIQFQRDDLRWEFSKEEVNSKMSAKLELLQKYKGRYCLKVHTSQIVNTRMLSWLEAHYNWIFLERRNVFEQLLSYLVSTSTNLWYDDRLQLLKDGSLLAEQKYFFAFFVREWIPYHLLKNFLSPRHILYYEDFTEKTFNDFLSPLGLSNLEAIKTPWTVKKQNRHDKLSLFANKEEICQWWDNRHQLIASKYGLEMPLG